MSTNKRPLNSDVNPWSACAGQNVLFIIDAGNAIEVTLLQQWMATYKNDNPVLSSRQIVVNISRGKHSPEVRQLVDILQQEESISVIPLRVAWMPSKEMMSARVPLWHFLLGNPRQPNSWRAKRLIKKHPERVSYILGEGGSINTLKDKFQSSLSDNDFSWPAFADFIIQEAGLTLEIAERQLQGGRYKTPHFVHQRLQSDKKFNTAIKAYAESNKLTSDEVWTSARDYMQEMISKPDPFYLDINARFNTFAMKQGYEDNLVINQEDLMRVREMVRQNPAMILFSHKSYLDGMLFPKILYDADFPMTHTFVGANMGIPLFGQLLRRSGGIFLRRSFRDNPLYKLTLKHYVGYLMSKRFPMQWAFEGGRSRLGKLMPPQFGLLKYVLEACYASEAKNIHIIPVSINYDIISDVKEYVAEQKGMDKKPESLSWFIRYIRGLKRPMGRIYIDIGDAVVLESAPKPEDKLALSKIAFDIAVKTNEVTPITFPAVFTMGLLGTAPQALTAAELEAEVMPLVQWARDRGIRITDDFESGNRKHMLSVLDMMIEEGILTRYEEGPKKVYGIAPEQYPVASYYRNSIVHYFVNKALIEVALVLTSQSSNDDPEHYFWQQIDRLRDLFKFEFFYAPTEQFHREIRDELNRDAPNWQENLGGGRNQIVDMLREMSPLVAHNALLIYTEAYRVVAELFSSMKNNESMAQKPCVEQALKYGRQAYLQRRISSEASIGRLLFENGYKLLASKGLTSGGDTAEATEKLAQRRTFAKELRDMSRALNYIKAIETTKRTERADSEILDLTIDSQ